MFTPIHLQVASATRAMKPVVCPFRNFTGSTPNSPSTLLISEPSISPNISRKIVPATTTEVSAGKKKADLKNSRPHIALLLISTANSMGNGIRITSVRIMYTALLRTALKKMVSPISLV
ncbi:hypothetical protein D3C73_1296520 [compost metagenome]